MSPAGQQLRPAIVCTMGRGVNALSIVRSLGRIRVPVYVIASNSETNLAIRSKYCTGATELSSISHDCLSHEIRCIAREHKSKPVLFVDNDLMFRYILEDESLSSHVILLPVSSRRSLLQLLDKKHQIVAASRAGLDVPRTWFPKTWQEISAIYSPLRRKLIAKKRFPVPIERDSFKIIAASDGESLSEKLREHRFKPEELLVQEYIEGSDDNVFIALCYNPLQIPRPIIVTGRKLVQSGTGDGGIMALGETIENEEIWRLSEKFLRFLNYKGYFGIEFKYCRHRKKYFFIEVNVRPERINALARAAGVDLNVICFLDLGGYEDLLERLKARPLHGTAWIDGGTLVTAIRRRREWTSLVPFVKSIFKRKEWAVFALYDMRPFLCSLSKSLRSFLSTARFRLRKYTILGHKRD